MEEFLCQTLQSTKNLTLSGNRHHDNDERIPSITSKSLFLGRQAQGHDAKPIRVYLNFNHAL